MSELLLQIGISNLCVSSALAILAWAMQTHGKRPQIAYVLWLLAIVKLLTPPVMTVPLVAVPGPDAAVEISMPGIEASGGAESMATIALTESAFAASSSAVPASQWIDGSTALALLWLIGSVGVLVASITRIVRFHRCIGVASDVAPSDVQSLAEEIASGLGLSRAPTVYTTSAHVSPMVWWIGGRVRVLLPTALSHEIHDPQVRWILAHELAHVRRHDHLVRWLEWLTCVAFWWNPVAWWARRNLRVNEEICCDALVLTILEPNPKAYAKSLLNVVESLSAPVLRPPAVASGINSGGILERRIRMIISTDRIPRTPRWLTASVLLLAVGLLPLGVAYAQGDGHQETQEKPDRSARLESHLSKNGLTDEQIDGVLGALEKLVAEIKEEGREFELDPRMEAHLADGVGLTEEQIDLVLQLGQRLALSERKKKDAEIPVERITPILEENGFTDAQIEMVFGAMERLIPAIQAKGEDFEMDARIEDYLVEEVGLTDEQIELILRISQRLAGSMKKKEAAPIPFERFTPVLEENGFTEEQIKKVFRVLKRIVPAIQAEGGEFEMNARLEGYLVDEVGLTDAQIELLLGISQRIAFVMKEKQEAGTPEGLFERITPLLVEEGLTDEQIEKLSGLLLRILPGMQSAGEDFEMSERLENYLVDEVGLDDAQIELFMGLSQRIAMGLKKKTAGIPEGMLERIQLVLEEDGFSEGQIEMVFGVMKRIIPMLQSQGEDFEAGPRIEGYLAEEVGLTDEQIELVLGLSQRIALALKKQKTPGVSKKVFERIQPILTENGLNEEQCKMVFGALQRLVPAMQSQGEAFTLDPGMQGFLVDEIGLVEEQVDLVLGLAQRIALRLNKQKTPGISKKVFERIQPILTENGLDEEQCKMVFGALQRLVPAMQSQGEAFTLDPGMQGFLVDEIGLDEEQIDLVLGLAKRIALGLKKKSAKL